MKIGRLRSLMCLAVVTAWGCKTSGLPTWDQAEPGQGELAAADVGDDDAAAAEGGAASDEETPTGGDVDPEAPTASDVDPEAPTANEPAITKPPADDTTKGEAPALPKPLHTKVDASCGKDPGVGQKLKAFSLKSTGGKPVSNRSWGNRVLLVNFWGTWCKPCLKELPEFDQLYRRYRKHGLTLVAIATDEDPAPVQEFIDKRRLAAKVAIGGEDYAGQYSSPKFPFTFVVDTKGVIRASYRGYRPECMGKLEADIREQLEKRGK